VSTFLVLSLIAVYLVYLPKAPTINHLPNELNVEAQDWMNYAPTDAEKVYLMNFTRVRSDLGSTDVFSNKELLTLYGYTTKVTLDSAYYSATALFPSADPTSGDIALNIIEVSPTLSASLSTELTEKDAHPIVYGSHTIHTVLRSTGSSPAYVDGYLVLEGSHLLYSDTARGLEEVKKALDTRDRGGSYLDRPNIKAPYYLVSVSDELSFSYSTLPSGIKDVVTLSKSLSYDGKNVTLRCVYSFNDTDTAVRNLANIKALDFQGKEFAVYDNYIVSITDYGEGSLVSLLRSM
jgi:hypothetical protein